ncbi:MAG: transposase [Segatella copri]|nr:transposase [Lachnospiraceae bacterium]
MGRKAKTPYMQINLGDRFLALSKRGQEAILNSRLGHFGDETFPRIDPDVFMVLYSDHGRGPSYLQGLVGAYLVMNMLNLTADELILRIDSDIAIQYALHTTSLEKQPFSRRNLFYFIARLEDYEKRTGIDLIEECFKSITSDFAHDMGLDKPGNSGRIKKRMDSMMIPTHAAKLTRPGIIYAVNQDALLLYTSLNGEDNVVPSLFHYLDESDRNAVIYHNKDDMEDKLTALLAESRLILYLLQDEDWHDFQEYKNLVRCVKEQSNQSENGAFIPKPNKDISGSSLQSPEDPAATARTKAGKTHVGFVANVTETYDENGNSLITDADMQPNTYSDSDFMKDSIRSKKDPVNEEQVVTDGAYYSFDNAEAAAEKGILIVPTALTGTETNQLCADFTLSDDGEAIHSCPNGCKPFEQKYHENTKRIDAKFSRKDCGQCPYRAQCPGKDQKKSVKVSISSQMVNRAELQEALGDEEHKQLARERNAVEAIPSIFRRKYGLNNIRTLMTQRVRSKLFAICLAYNGQKHQKFLNNHRGNCAFA